MIYISTYLCSPIRKVLENFYRDATFDATKEWSMRLHDVLYLRLKSKEPAKIVINEIISGPECEISNVYETSLAYLTIWKQTFGENISDAESAKLGRSFVERLINNSVDNLRRNCEYISPK